MSARWRGGEDDAAALGRIVLYLLMAATTPALLAVGATRYEPLPYRIPPIHPPEGSTLAMLMRDLPHYELSPKYQEVAGIVAANAALGRKTLVWSTFVRNLTSLGHLLDHFEPAIVHGGTEDRDDHFGGSGRILTAWSFCPTRQHLVRASRFITNAMTPCIWTATSQLASLCRALTAFIDWV